LLESYNWAVYLWLECPRTTKKSKTEKEMVEKNRRKQTTGKDFDVKAVAGNRVCWHCFMEALPR
jgi:hypothetical protein